MNNNHKLYLGMKYGKLFFVLFIYVVAGCRTKERDLPGKGGNATIYVHTQHHGVSKDLTNMKILIAYNTLEAPGNALFDDSVSCTLADSMVTGAFTGLKNGDYYLLGVGYDTAFKQRVRGAIPYSISQQDNQTIFLPVSEY